ncbi:hypothetical protein T08_3616, partial [Trichinella sp. T8]
TPQHNHRTEHNVKRELRSLARHGWFYTSVGVVLLRFSSKIPPRSLFSLTATVIGRHGIFQLIGGVSFSSRQAIFTLYY